MRIQDIVIGEHYRHKITPYYGYAKAISILKPHTGLNEHRYSIVECEWTVGKNDTMGLIKYFRPSNLIKEKTNV
jgi:hypothetical protein